ncbi:hypothetical protein OS493_014707 [Desmophyllum pertusum]|uniref:RING-type domain-containing protein n=1 Tax=Desmophyllum pertusum TaxID=174260 RepID=A0A9W9YGG1_9CNID|nr:hypothetical protein OS493_014707 [Desmophyllum pertusum]
MATHEEYKDTDFYDYCCPVCLEEFQDPKVLPTCHHNVCRQCLENIIMRAKPAYLQCPTCRQESFIREEDLDGLQTNVFLVKLLQQTEPQKEKEKLSKGIQACVTKVEVLEELIKELKLCRVRKRERGDCLKEEIHRMADAVVEKTRRSEAELTNKLDDFYFSTRRSFQSRSNESRSFQTEDTRSSRSLFERLRSRGRSIATDGENHVAVADPENNNILILNRNGNFVKRFTSPPNSSQPAMMFSGVAFSKDNKDLVAVNGARDVHLINPKEGTFKVSYRSSSQWGVKYCFVSTDPSGRFLLTCEPLAKQYRACIVVHSDAPFGKPDLRFGFSARARCCSLSKLFFTASTTT